MCVFDPVNEATFDSQVLQSTQPVLVEFGASWCGPCKRMGPELLKLEQSIQGKAKMVCLDVDESSCIAVRYQVMTVPTLILFKDGKEMERSSGFQPFENISKRFAPHIS
jgi:thioredoxin 1